MGWRPAAARNSQAQAFDESALSMWHLEQGVLSPAALCDRWIAQHWLQKPGIELTDLQGSCTLSRTSYRQLLSVTADLLGTASRDRALSTQTCRGVQSGVESLARSPSTAQPRGQSGLLTAETSDSSLSRNASTSDAPAWLLEGKCYRETPAEPGKAKARWAVIAAYATALCTAAV